MKNDKKTASHLPRPVKTATSVAPRAKKRAQARAAVKLASPSAKDAVSSTVTGAPSSAPAQLVARSIFGRATEVHRPRLVLFVGTPADSYAPVAALWFAALASESKATIVLAYAGDAPPLAPEMMTALSENGIDTRRVIARTLTPELLAAADLVVTLSSGRQSRVKLPPTTRRREHWTIPGRTRAGASKARSARPRAKAENQDALLEARSLRDALRARVAMLVFSEGWGRPEISREDARVTRAKPAVRTIERGRSRPFGGPSDGMTFSFLADATPAWFASPALSPLSLR